MHLDKIKKVKGGFTMINKKGVSAVIATVLLILITIATVTIVWTVVVPLVKDNLGEAESFTDCIYAAQEFEILEENACYSVGSDEITFEIPTQMGGKDFNFYGIQLSSSFEYNWDLGGTGDDITGLEEISISEKITDSNNLPPLGGTKTISVVAELNNVGSATDLDSIDVSLTVLTMRNDEESSCGDTTKTITLTECTA